MVGFVGFQPNHLSPSYKFYQSPCPHLEMKMYDAQVFLCTESSIFLFFCMSGISANCGHD